MSRLHCVTLMRLLSATVASYKDTHAVDHFALSVLCHLAWRPYRAKEGVQGSSWTAALPCSSPQLTSDPSDNAALIYDSCRQDTGSRQPVQCVFGSHVIDYPASVAFLKCNLSEQHERCETPEKTTLPPSHPRTYPWLYCISIPLLEPARKLNSPSSCKTLPGIKPSPRDLL